MAKIVMYECDKCKDPKLMGPTHMYSINLAGHMYHVCRECMVQFRSLLESNGFAKMKGVWKRLSEYIADEYEV